MAIQEHQAVWMSLSLGFFFLMIHDDSRGFLWVMQVSCECHSKTLPHGIPVVHDTIAPSVSKPSALRDPSANQSKWRVKAPSSNRSISKVLHLNETLRILIPKKHRFHHRTLFQRSNPTVRLQKKWILQCHGEKNLPNGKSPPMGSPLQGAVPIEANGNVLDLFIFYLKPQP